MKEAIYEMNKKLFKIISVVLSITLLFSIISFNAVAIDTNTTESEESETSPYPLGCLPELPDEIEFPSFGNAGAPNTTKTSVDLTSKFPTPGEQDGSSCVAWAIYYLVSGEEYIKRGWSKTEKSHMFSPYFIYNSLNKDEDKGLRLSEAMQFLGNSGICTLNYFSCKSGDYKTDPTGIAKANAELYKPFNVYSVKGVQEMKNAIASNHGVVIRVRAYPDLNNISSSNPIYDNTLGFAPGNHAICLIGYDDSKSAFKFINSWGTDWGLGGYGWISYRLIDSSLANIIALKGYCINLPENDDYILGDVNGDGKISIVDSKYVLQYDAQSRTLTDRQFALADVNGDAKVSIADSKSILNYITGNITKMPLYN